MCKTHIKQTRDLWYNISCDKRSEGNLKSHQNLRGRGKRKAALLDKVIMERHLSRDPTEGNTFCQKTSILGRTGCIGHVEKNMEVGRK